MAQRRSAARQGADDAPKSSAPKRNVVKAGGHVIEADPPAKAPAESVQCSVCGQALSKGRCPNGHGGESGGWGVESESEG